MLFFWMFYSSKKPEKKSYVFKHHNNNFIYIYIFIFFFFIQKIRILEWFEGLYDWSMMLEITGINYNLKYIKIENSYFK